MATPIFLVDAFTDSAFTGNPAGVCITEAEADEAWMQSLAMEMNQAETAFIRPIDGGFELRWFTPTVEVDLCGHATLASAHTLWSHDYAPTDQPIKFLTRSGWLIAERIADEIVLDFPALPVRESKPHPGLSEVFPNATFVGTSGMDWFIELGSEEEILKLSPNMEAVKALGLRGVIVTAQSSSDRQDFVSRFFAPQSGVDEDPVTGSAHCALATYWAAKLGSSSLVGYQASRRGGFVGIEVVGDRVKLRGRATTVLTGLLA